MSNKVAEVAKNWNPSVSKRKKHKTSSNGRFYSLSDWFGTRDLPQQDKVKSGYQVQNFVEYLVIHSPKGAQIVDDIVVKVLEGDTKEADLIFKLLDQTTPQTFTVYYREVKGNPNLDSEKRPATADKIAKIDAGLKVRYPGAEVNSGFLCPAWLEGEGDVEGLNDFLTILGYDTLSFEEFVALGLELGSKIRAAFLAIT